MPGNFRARDANDVARHVKQRPSGVARVDGRVGLEHADGLAADVDFARQRADIAARHRERQLAQRIADGDAPLADGDGIRIADRYVRESLRLNLQQRHIAQRIAADDLRRIRAPRRAA